MAKKPAVSSGDAGRYPEVMTIDQVAEYLHLHKQVIYRHVKKGNIPVSRIGATIRFKKSVIDAWLEDSAMRSLRRAGETESRGIGEPAKHTESRDKFVWE